MILSKSSKSILLLLIIIILKYFPSQAQNNKEILCRIIDKESKVPISYATIRIKSKNNGLVANFNGDFRMPFRYVIQKDTIILSSIGYKSKEVALKNLKNLGIHIFKLESKVEKLEEITVIAKRGSNLSADRIVQKAIDNIHNPRFYSNTPHSYIGYYRDYQLVNDDYFNLNEAIIEVFDSGFQTNKIKYKDNQTLLYSYNQNNDFPKDSLLTIAYDNKKTKIIDNATISPLGGNELSILNIHNPIRNFNKKSFSFIYTFENDFYKNHAFYLIKKLYFDDTQLYEIKFNANPELVKGVYSVSGTIYISSENFSIYKLEYSVYKKNNSLPLYSIKTEYIPKGESMFLNYLSFNNFFEVKKRDEFKITNINFNKQDNSFYVKFNNSIKKECVTNKNNFKLFYKNRELSINKIELKEVDLVKISLINGTLPKFEELSKNSSKEFKYRFKKISDINNRKLNRKSIIKAYQYRELFVQEVFLNKKINSNSIFVKKLLPLSKSEINNFDEESKYWINTPLKKIKN